MILIRNFGFPAPQVDDGNLHPLKPHFDLPRPMGLWRYFFGWMKVEGEVVGILHTLDIFGKSEKLLHFESVNGEILKNKLHAIFFFYWQDTRQKEDGDLYSCSYPKLWNYQKKGEVFKRSGKWRNLQIFSRFDSKNPWQTWMSWILFGSAFRGAIPAIPMAVQVSREVYRRTFRGRTAPKMEVSPTKTTGIPHMISPPKKGTQYSKLIFNKMQGDVLYRNISSVWGLERIFWWLR